MNNLRRFTTEADYSAATLNYPAVSWVVSGDTVHFDKSTPTVNDKVMIASYGGAGETYFVFFNPYASTSGDITSIILDDVEVNPIVYKSNNQYDAEQTHIAKYTLNTTTVGDWFGGDLGCSYASTPSSLDILIPSQITHIGYIPSHAVKMVIEATTPPSTNLNMSSFPHPIYVLDSALSAYQNDSIWGQWSDYLMPISEYQGNLPV